ncbi:unnamed protein product, partial [Cyprideis torosa]
MRILLTDERGEKEPVYKDDTEMCPAAGSHSSPAPKNRVNTAGGRSWPDECLLNQIKRSAPTAPLHTTLKVAYQERPSAPRIMPQIAYLSQQKRPSFFGQFVENVRSGLEKDKQMKESLKKFRQEAEKLEHSEALKAARKKFENIEAESQKGSEVLRKKILGIKEKVGTTLSEVQKTPAYKKVEAFGGELGRKAANSKIFDCSIIRMISRCHSLSLFWRPSAPRIMPQIAYLSQQKRPSFFGQFVENVRSGLEKDKQMKESLKKFRQEAEKLEHSEALKAARKKFENIEAESQKGSEVLRKKILGIKEKVGTTLSEVQKTPAYKKVEAFGGELGRKAASATETLSDKGKEVASTATFKTIQDRVKAVQQEVEDTSLFKSRVYKAPKELRKRQSTIAEEKEVEANPDATGMVLHKDSKWYASWQNFKDNNPYYNKVLEMKIRYDESDSPVIRASRMLTDKVSDIMGGLFQRTELSEALTEIIKIDPSFDKDVFLRECEREIIPTILEAINRPDLDILKDWCHEAPYNVLSTPIKQALTMGYVFDSKILDIDNVDLVMGKVVEQGPILVLSFRSQQIMCLKNVKGEVVEGDPNKIMRVTYVWVLCRDQNELDPRAAWRLMDLSAQSTEQML